MPDLKFECWMPWSGTTPPRGIVSFELDGVRMQVPRARDGVFRVLIQGLAPGRHTCSFIVAGGFGWEWKAAVSYGASRPLRRRGVLGSDPIAQRDNIVLEVPDLDPNQALSAKADGA